MKKKLAAIILSTVLAGALLAGCGGSSTASSTEAEKET